MTFLLLLELHQVYKVRSLAIHSSSRFAGLCRGFFCNIYQLYSFPLGQLCNIYPFAPSYINSLKRPKTTNFRNCAIAVSLNPFGKIPRALRPRSIHPSGLQSETHRLRQQGAEALQDLMISHDGDGASGWDESIGATSSVVFGHIGSGTSPNAGKPSNLDRESQMCSLSVNMGLQTSDFFNLFVYKKVRNRPSPSFPPSHTRVCFVAGQLTNLSAGRSKLSRKLTSWTSLQRFQKHSGIGSLPS